jgi:hypothetical protein
MLTYARRSPEVDRSVSGRGATRRGPPTLLMRAFAAVLVVFALLAVLAATAQARPARERAAVAETVAAATPAAETPASATPAAETPATANRAAETEERTAARRASRESKRAQRSSERARHKRKPPKPRPPRKKRKPGKGPERENGVVTSTCTQVNWTFRKFPDMPNNTVVEKVAVAKLAPYNATYRFNGATSAMTTAINAPPGRNRIDANGMWRTNGLSGGFDIHSRKRCPPVPAFSIEKLQRIAGSSGSFTTSPLTGEVGQMVEYEIVVKNTGNVALTFSSFSDPHCDPGTLAGGPGQAALAPGRTTSTGGSSTYACDHVLTSSDKAVGSYRNVASDTATPPPGEGAQVTTGSNTVVVNLPSTPRFSIEKLQQVAGGSGSFTTSPLTGEVGQTVNYEIVVKNTGDVPLTFSNFSDPHCDPGTIAGGPGTSALAVGGSSTYTCDHVLTSADQAAGSYSNVASDTATPRGGGAAVTNGSNTVVVGVTPLAAPPSSPPPSPPSTTTSTTTSSPAPSASSASTQSPGTGVLGFSAASVPTLQSPQGCVRSSFHVRVRAAGVQRVVFYLDGRKLKTLTSRSARSGMFTFVIDPAKLSVGAHRLKATITMAPKTSSTKPMQASRTVIVLRCRATVLMPKFTG